MKINKKIFLSAMLFTLFVLVGCGSLDNPTIFNTEREVTNDNSSSLGSNVSFNPGVFEGESTDGFYGRVAVSVTIDANGSISDVEVTYNNETEAFADRAFSNLIPAVIAANSANVDTISGATYSSTGFLNAVADALLQAGGGQLSDPGMGEFSPAELNAGTFTGVGEGFYGDITVEIIVDANGSIDSIDVLSHNETDAFADRAFGELIPAAINSQSAILDAVSGATASSNGFIEALANAIIAAQ